MNKEQIEALIKEKIEETYKRGGGLVNQGDAERRVLRELLKTIEGAKAV